MKEKFVFVVRAIRFGDQQLYSYTVGVFEKKMAALNAAETEENYRGGKYRCEITQWELNKGIEGTPTTEKEKYPKVINKPKKSTRLD